MSLRWEGVWRKRKTLREFLSNFFPCHLSVRVWPCCSSSTWELVKMQNLKLPPRPTKSKSAFQWNLQMILMHISLRSAVVKSVRRGHGVCSGHTWNGKSSMGVATQCWVRAELRDRWCVVTPVYLVLWLTSLLAETEWELSGLISAWRLAQQVRQKDRVESGWSDQLRRKAKLGAVW